MNGSNTQTLGYDALDRLTSVTSGLETASYTYDADGNRTHQVYNGTATTFTYASASNRLASASGGVSASYGYNAYGSTTTINGLAAYTYDPFGRLSNAGGAGFLVSAEDQRLRKTSASGTTYFVPDAGGAMLAESLNGTWYDYVWLNGRLVTVIANGGVFPVHADQTGRPLALTHPATQAILWQAAGLAFDRNVTQNNWGPFNVGFPGQYWDSEDGLWQNGFRDYDATTGRYIESDPIGLAGGINTYGYAGSNPVSIVDPLGLYCWSQNQINAIAGAAGGAVSGGVAGAKGGLRGAVASAGVGAFFGGAAGYFSSNATEGRVLVNGIIASAGDGPLSGPFGGVMGAVVTHELEKHGVNESLSALIGSAVGGGVGGAAAGFLKYESQKLGIAGLRAGLSGAAVSVAVGAALKASNKCGCGKK